MISNNNNSSSDIINQMILSNLLHDPEYFVKVYHYLKPEYFSEGSSYKDLFVLIDRYYKQYEGKPTKYVMNIALESSGLPEERYNKVKKLLGDLEPIKGEDRDSLVKITEKHIQDVAYYNAIVDVVQIYQNEKRAPEHRDKRLPSLESTQDLVAKALAISFDNDLGHEYNTGFEERLANYQEGVMKIPFRLESMNEMTNGGIEYKTLNIPIAPTGVGKSMWLCSLASDYILDGRDVLYITLEMSEMAVAKRIDANLLDISLSNLNEDTIDGKEYLARAQKFKEMPHIGNLRIKNYPSREATVNDFRALLDDYRIKEDFVPEIIIVDYLMIVGYNGGARMAEHERLSRIAVQLRALAFEYNAAVWAPMQTNRDGSDKSDLNISDMAGSFDVSHHADFIITIIETEDGIERRVQRIKVVKSRYGSKDENNSIELFVTKGKQRYEDLDDFKSSPPNVPPRLAMSQPIVINDDGMEHIGNDEKEVPKSIEREITFTTDDDDLSKRLENMDW